MTKIDGQRLWIANKNWSDCRRLSDSEHDIGVVGNWNTFQESHRLETRYMRLLESSGAPRAAQKVPKCSPVRRGFKPIFKVYSMHSGEEY